MANLYFNLLMSVSFMRADRVAGNDMVFTAKCRVRGPLYHPSTSTPDKRLSCAALPLEID